uniref:Uncharacterized protein n=1 Tax=Nomascus leucogenys TaxID=61853 RepID=A0A2I3GSI2_NOMLE
MHPGARDPELHRDLFVGLLPSWLVLPCCACQFLPMYFSIIMGMLC